MPNFRKKALRIGVGLFAIFTCLLIPLIEIVTEQVEDKSLEEISSLNGPDSEIVASKMPLKMRLFGVSAAVLLFYSLALWIALYRMSRPFWKIFKALQPYQEGKEPFLPELTVYCTNCSDNEIGNLALTLNSLTARIHAQTEKLVKQKNETEAILESVREGVIAIDPAGIVTFANSAACQILGIVREKLTGEAFSEIKTLHQNILRKSEELFYLAKEKNEMVSQTFIEEDTKKIYLDLIAAPQEPKGGIVLVLQDKTSDYKVIGMGKDFIANASHELRTPITIIRGFAEALLALPDLSAEKNQEITEKIFKTCLRLDSLVKSLLTLADVESANYARFRHTNLVPLVENCRYLLVTAHPHANVSFECHFPTIPIWADSDLIELAISNLLENAVKYSSKEVQIEISLACCPSFVTLSIQDRGLGISEPDLAHIFDRFYTVDKARSRRFGGAGLGLSIVNTIVQKHKGSLTVSSDLGVGSVFSISFPLYFQKIERTSSFSDPAAANESDCSLASKAL